MKKKCFLIQFLPFLITPPVLITVHEHSNLNQNDVSKI